MRRMSGARGRGCSRQDALQRCSMGGDRGASCVGSGWFSEVVGVFVAKYAAACELVKATDAASGSPCSICFEVLAIHFARLSLCCCCHQQHHAPHPERPAGRLESPLCASYCILPRLKARVVCLVHPEPAAAASQQSRAWLLCWLGVPLLQKA